MLGSYTKTKGASILTAQLKQIQILKASGERELFSQAKLFRSLRKAGASDMLVEQVWQRLLPEIEAGLTSDRLQKRAFRHLRGLRKTVAARYQLKRAMMELGPSGYPFERLIGEVFRARGFEVQVGQILNGRCVKHEVDVVGTLEKTLLLVECKYRNLPGYKCDVKVPLYIHSRFEDIRIKRNLTHSEVQPWIATNARFSGDAVAYAGGVGLNLIGWDQPAGESLKDWLETLKLYPLTVLTSLNQTQKKYLLEHKLILCRDILERPELLLHLPGKSNPAHQKRVMQECHHLLSL